MSYLNPRVDLKNRASIDYSSDGGSNVLGSNSEPDLFGLADIGWDGEKSSTSLPNLSSPDLGASLSITDSRDALFYKVFSTNLQKDISESDDWVDVGAIDSEHRVSELLHNSGWFEPSNCGDHFKKVFMILVFG